MPTMRRTFGPGISPSLPIQRCSLQAYPIARKFARIQGQVSQYSLPIFAHYVMRRSPVSGADPGGDGVLFGGSCHCACGVCVPGAGALDAGPVDYLSLPSAVLGGVQIVQLVTWEVL